LKQRNTAKVKETTQSVMDGYTNGMNWRTKVNKTNESDTNREMWKTAYPQNYDDYKERINQWQMEYWND
jgi:hypothetical protein